MSPELFFEQNDRELTTRPMKGTTQRGVTDQEDLEQASWLEQDPKNRSENMMIVDLLRNDMNRISEVGSEHVERLCQVEQYSTVWQIDFDHQESVATRCGLGYHFRLSLSLWIHHRSS